MQDLQGELSRNSCKFEQVPPNFYKLFETSCHISESIFQLKRTDLDALSPKVRAYIRIEFEWIRRMGGTARKCS